MNYFGLHSKSAWHCLLILLGLMFTMAWSPAAKAQPCATTNLSNVLGTSCNIGTLDFTFGSLFTYNYNSSTGNGTAYTASDFTFTPVINGFTLSFDGPPQTVTAPANGYDFDYVILDYSAMDSNGDFIGESATGGTLTATGSTGDSFSFYQGLLCSDANCVASEVSGYDEFTQTGGVETQVSSEDQLFGPPFSVGTFGSASPFDLQAENGASATWDGTPTTFTFDTEGPVSPTPEPTTMLLFATGLLGIILRKKLLA